MPKFTRGREYFNRYRGIIRILEQSVQMLPTPVVSWLLASSRGIGGRSGLVARYVLLGRLAIDVGDVVAIYEDVYLKSPHRLRLGSNVSIHPMSYIDASGGIVIGNNVSIAHGVTIMSTEHQFSRTDVTIREQPVTMAEVKIEDDVWIGAGVKVLAGVTIGSRVVVGAGAVVTKSIPTGSIALGVPAAVVKQI